MNIYKSQSFQRKEKGAKKIVNVFCASSKIFRNPNNWNHEDKKHEVRDLKLSPNWLAPTSTILTALVSSLRSSIFRCWA